MDCKLTRTAIALAVSGVFSATASADIIISQYVEGGSYNKAIEIANTSDVEVSLDGYKLAKSKDGSGSWESEISLNGKVLAAKSVYVIANTKASDAIKAIADELDSTVVAHNGDDPIALLKEDGSVHDMIGVMGDVDWGKDSTLVRSSEAPTASATYNPDHWIVLEKDTITGLGELDLLDPPPPFACEAADGSEPTFTSINEIQGEGASSPFIDGYPFITEKDFFVKGVVSAVTSGLTKGFYLQALTPDSNPKTSDGLFINTGEGSSNLVPGDVVCVKGKIQEDYSHTQLKTDANSYVKQSTQSAPDATKFVVGDGETLRDALERYEGMNIELSAESQLYVTRNFSRDYDAKRNNMMLSHQLPLFKPTQLHAAESAEAVALAAENAARRVFLESDAYAPSGKIPYFPKFAQDDDQDGSSENHIRLGSRIEGLQAVVTYSYGEYRLIATNEATKETFVTKSDDFDVARKNNPEIKDSDLRIASFNVLNYFNSVAESGYANPTGQNRGAKTLDEFTIQKSKIVTAMSKMDADIIGLMEIENNGFGDTSAIKDLVDALNSSFADKKDHYTYVEVSAEDKYQDEYLGSDAIMVAILYRPSQATPSSAAEVILTPEQHIAADTITRDENGTPKGNPGYNKYQRHSLLQTFKLTHNDKELSVVVNHFKSKGSECIEEWIAGVEESEPTDLQGNCNNFRVSAAQAIGEELKDIDGDILVMGDMNAYGLEDPLLVLTDYSKDKYDREIKTAAHTTLGVDENGDAKPHQLEGEVITAGYGYINLNTKLHGTDTFSYTYSGELGNLDHALASASLADKVVAIEDWHINASETNLFEYSSKYTGSMPKYNDAFSASDHDPVIIAIDLPEKPTVKLPPVGENLVVKYTLPVSAQVNDIVKVEFVDTNVAIQSSSSAVAFAAPLSAEATVTQADLDSGSINVEFSESIEAGSYTMTQVLSDSNGVERERTTESVNVVANVSPETDDDNGGSFGFRALLALFGLGLIRRRK